MPGITAVASPTPQHGGRRGWWGQARLVGAGEANGGRKPPASCPSLRPNATGPNPVPTRVKLGPLGSVRDGARPQVGAMDTSA